MKDYLSKIWEGKIKINALQLGVLLRITEKASNKSDFDKDVLLTVRSQLKKHEDKIRH